jgi:hypothetical protein
LQQDSNELALDKWKAQQDVFLEQLGLKQDAKGDKYTKSDFLQKDLSGWGDAAQYSYYMTKKDPKAQRVINDIIYDMKTGWGKDDTSPNRMYDLAVDRLKKAGIYKTGYDRIIRDVLSIGTGTW